MLCTPPAIVLKIVAATGPSHAQHGYMTLANGTAIELDGSAGTPEAFFLERLRRGDHVQACFVDQAAMNGGRLCIVENEETKDSFYSLGVPKRGKRP